MSGEQVLVCGATGYVGGRLVPRLLDEGYRVRCLVRSPDKLQLFPWYPHKNLEVIPGDLDDVQTVRRAAEGTDAAYYLVHSMISAGGDYVQRDRELAEHFVEGLRGTSCRRILYLGGLGELGNDLSKHLSSRREVAEILQSSECETTVLRAAMIIGSGSASFEILRYLVDRLPIMVTPKWVRVETQPIAIRDVLRYLVECLSVPETTGRVIDIGGQNVLSYRRMMELMAQASGLPKRWIIPVPVLTPRLSSLWIHLVTPLSSRIARPLAEGLRNRTVCRDDAAQRLMPGPLFSVKEAIDAALGKHRSGQIETRWSTAGEMPGERSCRIVAKSKSARRRKRLIRSSAASEASTVIGGPTGCGGCVARWTKLLAGPDCVAAVVTPKKLPMAKSLISGESTVTAKMNFSACGPK